MTTSGMAKNGSRFELQAGSATDVGLQRSRNEDRYAIYLPQADEETSLQGLLLVADGMGGERGGEQASQLAVERLFESLSEPPADWAKAGDAEVEELLRRAVRETSDEIFSLGEKDPEVHGLGTTIVLLVVRGDRVSVAHVGDSRCYRVRDRQIERLTADHTWIEDQIGAGTLSREEARNHPQRNVLTRSLGDAVSPGVDVRTEALEDGDLLILCTDGLTGALSDQEILDNARRYPRCPDLAEALVALANQRDGSDNVTVVAMRCAAAARYAREPDDTEPIARPAELLAAPQARGRVWGALALGLVLGLLLGFLGLRLYADRLFQSGTAHFEHREYLHSSVEFERLLELSLGEDKSAALLEMLGELELVRRRGDEVSPPPAEPPAAEPLPRSDASPPNN